MSKDERDWKVSDEKCYGHVVEIEGQSYALPQGMAAITHALLLIAESIKNK